LARDGMHPSVAGSSNGGCLFSLYSPTCHMFAVEKLSCTSWIETSCTGSLLAPAVAGTEVALSHVTTDDLCTCCRSLAAPIDRYDAQHRRNTVGPPLIVIVAPAGSAAKKSLLNLTSTAVPIWYDKDMAATCNCTVEPLLGQGYSDCASSPKNHCPRWSKPSASYV